METKPFDFWLTELEHFGVTPQRVHDLLESEDPEILLVGMLQAAFELGQRNVVIQEYAGFLYRLEYENGHPIMIPLPNQHPAAYKEKHRRVALELCLEKLEE